MTPPRHLRPVPADGPRRAVLYRRVSALMGREGERFMSPDLQLGAMRDMARRRDLLEVRVIDDIDVSGRTFVRSGIQQVLEMARRREIDVVAFYDLARLGRNVRESLRVIEELRDLGVAVMSANEQIDDSPEGQFQLTIWLGLAQLYSDQIGRRWREVQAHRAGRGLAHGPAPLGYRRQDGKLVADDLGPAVAKAFRDYAAGQLVSRIARDFSVARGRRTDLVVVKRMLANPVYVGQVRLGANTFPGEHQPLVTQPLWQRVQRRLEQDGRTPSRLLGGDNPLAGLVLCAHCHRRMRMQAENRAAGIVRLRCDGKDKLNDCTGPGAPLLVDVEAAIVAKLREEIGAEQVDVGKVVERRARATRARTDSARLRRERDAIDAALSKLNREWAATGMSNDERDMTARDLRADREALSVAIDQAERVVAAAPRRGQVPVSMGLLDRWDRLTVEEKRRTLLATVRVATLRQATRWREPVVDRLDVDLL